MAGRSRPPGFAALMQAYQSDYRSDQSSGNRSIDRASPAARGKVSGSFLSPCPRGSVETPRFLRRQTPPEPLGQKQKLAWLTPAAVRTNREIEPAPELNQVKRSFT